MVIEVIKDENKISHKTNSGDKHKCEDEKTGKDSAADCSSVNRFDKKPVNIKAFLFPLPLVPGSKYSISMHETLSKSKDNVVFTSIPIQRLLDHKWHKVKFLAHLLTFVYALYLVSITFVHHWANILFWMIF
jgi:hypothetical protein